MIYAKIAKCKSQLMVLALLTLSIVLPLIACGYAVGTVMSSLAISPLHDNSVIWDMRRGALLATLSSMGLIMAIVTMLITRRSIRLGDIPQRYGYGVIVFSTVAGVVAACCIFISLLFGAVHI